MKAGNRRFHALVGCGAVVSFVSAALASDLRAVYTEIALSPSANVPGAKDAGGAPVATQWVEIFNVAVRTTSDDWMVYGRNALGADLERILVKGTGIVGSAFLQEGQPVQGGGETGEVYDFFDGETSAAQSTPASWNAGGAIAYSARARGGVVTNDEKLAVFSGGSHSIIVSQGDAITSGGCTGLAYGNQMGSVQIFDGGTVGWGNSVIASCTNSPVYYRGTTATVESSITQVGTGAAFVGERITGAPQWWPAIAQTPDGLHYAMIANTDNPTVTQDLIVVVDGNAVLRENVAIGGVTPLAMDRVRMSTSGAWYARGSVNGGNDWAIRNGTVLAKTNDPITPGNAELWSITFNTFLGNANGDWILHGLTNNADLNLNTVIVKNGTDVIVRESDPVDVDGDGQYDDDAYVASIKNDAVWLTDNNVLYFVGSLKNLGGTNLGDALVRADLGGVNTCPADVNNDNTVNVTDLLAVIGAWGACANCGNCPADVAPAVPDCTVNVTDLLAVIGAWGACP